MSEPSMPAYHLVWLVLDNRCSIVQGLQAKTTRSTAAHPLPHDPRTTMMRPPHPRHRHGLRTLSFNVVSFSATNSSFCAVVCWAVRGQIRRDPSAFVHLKTAGIQQHMYTGTGTRACLSAARPARTRTTPPLQWSVTLKHVHIIG